MKADYTQIDADILAAIRQAPRQFSFFNAVGSPILAQAEHLAEELGPDRWGNKKPGWRIIDRRLCALSRRGQIKSVKNQGWTAVSQGSASV